MDEAKSLQTPTSGGREGWRGGQRDGAEQHFASTCARLRCVRRGLNATACLLILARNDNQLSEGGVGGWHSGVSHLQ